MSNGGFVFKVTIIKGVINIYTYKCPEKDFSFNINKYIQNVLKFSEFKGFWYGYDTSSNKEHGNTLLIEIGDEKSSYMYVGNEIYRFTTKSRIIDYISPVGNSSVPYPIAYDKDNIYFMLDKVYVNRMKFKTKINLINADNIYGEFYDNFYKTKNAIKMNNLIKDYTPKC